MKGILPFMFILSIVFISGCAQYDGTTTTTLATTTTVQPIPSVTANDQSIVDSKVTVASVFSVGPGWIVIHVDADGAPGTVIGNSPVVDGENADVVVTIDESAATTTLYAMLHTDVGEAGTFEFPGDDVPVKVDDKIVLSPFQIISEQETTTTLAATTVTVETRSTGFSPKTVTIKAGDTVKFVNNNPARTSWPASVVHPTHTTYPGSSINKCGTSEAANIFDACKGLALDEGFSFTFNEVGTWNYHDHLSPSVTGTVIVE